MPISTCRRDRFNAFIKSLPLTLFFTQIAVSAPGIATGALAARWLTRAVVWPATMYQVISNPETSAPGR